MNTKIALILVFIFSLGKISAMAQNHNIAEINYSDEATILIQKLSKDKMVNEFEGFLVEKKQNNLYINGIQQTETIAVKYLASLKQETIRVEVFPFKKRFQQHPNANILQLITPVMFSSPCVQKTTKEGC